MFQLPPANLQPYFAVVSTDYGVEPGFNGWFCLPVPRTSPQEARRYIVFRREWFEAKNLPTAPSNKDLKLDKPFFVSGRDNARIVGLAHLGDQTLIYKSVSGRDGPREICHSLISGTMGVGPRVYDFWYDATRPKMPFTLVMERIPGLDLDKLNRQGEPVHPMRLKLSLQRLEELAAIQHDDPYERNAILKDLKGPVVPIDLGLSRALPRPGKARLPKNRNDYAVGNIGDVRGPHDEEEILGDVSESKMKEMVRRVEEDPPSYRKYRPFMKQPPKAPARKIEYE
jgi:hypothetical protein